MQFFNVSQNIRNLSLSPIAIVAVQILMLLLIGFAATVAVQKLFIKIFNIKQDIKTESQQIKVTILKHTLSVVQTIIWVVVILSIASILKLTQFVRIITAVGVVTGYVARDFIMDFIMGILVLLEQQFRVGDIVTFTSINQLKGQVLEIGLRTTTIRLVDTQDLYIVSNRLLTSVIVHKRQLKKSSTKGVTKRHAQK